MSRKLLRDANQTERNPSYFARGSSSATQRRQVRIGHSVAPLFRSCTRRRRLEEACRQMRAFFELAPFGTETKRRGWNRLTQVESVMEKWDPLGVVLHRPQCEVSPQTSEPFHL